MPHSEIDAKSHLATLATALSTPGKIAVIGIDGPTASGKTILTDWLSLELEKKGIPTFVYRLDWCLAERSTRVKDLAHLKKLNRPFPFEGELHMHLQKAKAFLKTLSAFNEQLREGSFVDGQEIPLQDLYSREKGGTCSATSLFKPAPRMVVLLEGHYTLRNELDSLIDLNVLLLSDVQELLSRKIARVKDYRASDEATDYFWRIDLPSFKLHAARFGWNADLIIDNTNYQTPRLEGNDFLTAWTRNKEASPHTFAPASAEITSLIFSDSLQVSQTLREHTQNAIEMLKTWDLSVGRYLRTSLSDIQLDLEQLANDLVNQLNSARVEKSFKFVLTHTDSLHNVYYRKLPLTLGVGIVGNLSHSPEQFQVALIAIINQGELRISAYWAGGQRELGFDRKLGEITTNPNCVLKDYSSDLPLTKVTDEPFKVMLPTHFTVPGFLKGFAYAPTYTGREQENISASEALGSLVRDGGVGVNRFSLFSEIRFFKFCMDCCGIANMQTGNYLISLRHPNEDLHREFKTFSRAWQRPVSREPYFLTAEAQLDTLSRLDKTDAETFVEKNCPEFRMRDGYLFSHFMYGDSTTVARGINELKLMLSADNRFLRKKATQFILEYFPGFGVSTDKMWDDLPAGAEKEITLESFTLLGPSILAEVYLWLALRQENAAVLGANIYDIRSTSADAKAYILASATGRHPIVLQSSLNAVGQEEKTQEGASYGYLRPQNGAMDFVEACNRAVRDVLLTEGIPPPLYALGLDHVSAEHDKPTGRAKRFIAGLLKDRSVTHLVLDGSHLFKAENRTTEELQRAYDRVAEFAADLIIDARKMHLLDLEICAGEFNYVGNEKEAYVPDAREMRTFVRSFQKKVKEREVEAVLGRPMLLAGNLGTTHHGADTAPPPVEIASSWKETLKGENVVSAVLHGTSKSHRDVLARATGGCHKVNVAGDFLETLVKNLPERLYSKIRRSGKEPKKTLADVREEMNGMNVQEVKRLEHSLQEHAQHLMETIQSPSLSQMDEGYFRYISYVYTPSQVETIIDGIRTRLGKSANPNVSKLADSTVGRAFCVSMIEVPLEETKGALSEMLWEEGIRYFHVDAGDGKFISRGFSGLEKAIYLRERFPNALIHVHLMIENPHHSRGREKSIIQQYAEAGVNAIAIHPRAVTYPEEIDTALNLIRTLGCRPGIVIETSDSINEKIKGIIQRTQLDWAVIMGVPIGYGGQLFQFGTINRIAALNQFANQLGRDFLIECDGGLNMETLNFCKDAGAQLFSGWSIIKAPSHSEISSKLRQVKEALTKDINC